MAMADLKSQNYSSIIKSRFGVAFADEGIALKNGGITLPIMVLNPESSFSAIIQHQLEPEIYSLDCIF
jgi:alanine racemase